jgi:hypothetical protein
MALPDLVAVVNGGAAVSLVDYRAVANGFTKYLDG